VKGFWTGGSKLPAITALLTKTFERRRDRFCDLVLTAVREGVQYRIRKGDPLTRAEVERVNTAVWQLGFGIPELHDSQFLNGLVSADKGSGTVIPKPSPPAQPAWPQEREKLHSRFLTLIAEPNAQARGYAFEHFLNDLFRLNGLAPRDSFRVAGEQIDGSFEWQGQVVLMEARWRQTAADAPDLYILRTKVEGKSDWTRGLFISIHGFSTPASATFSKGKRANLVTMDGQDLILILEGHWTLQDAIRVKFRHAGETGDVVFPLAQATQ
jgi:hypothetical protein